MRINIVMPLFESRTRDSHALPNLPQSAPLGRAVLDGRSAAAGAVGRRVRDVGLKRFHYCFKRLHEIFTARITAEPIYELKTAFSHHAYLCAEHAAALRKRVGEMREPPLGLEDVPHAALELFFNEILCAPTTEALDLRSVRQGDARAHAQRVEQVPARDAQAGRRAEHPRVAVRADGAGRHGAVRRASAGVACR